MLFRSWNKIILINQYDIDKLNEDQKYILKIKEIPFLKFDNENGKIIYFNYKTKNLENINIQNYLIFYKQIKISFKKSLEIILKDLESGKLKIK